MIECTHVFIPILFAWYRYEKIKDYIAPTQVNSASLHENKKVFVCGGEDFKMYKFDYETGEELGELYRSYVMNETANLSKSDELFLQLY